MAHFFQVRDPRLSLWLSAVDEVTARKTSAGRSAAATGGPPPAPVRSDDLSNPLLLEATQFVAAEEARMPSPQLLPTGEARTEGVGTAVKACSPVAFQLALAKIRGDQAEAERLQDNLNFGSCDPGYADCAAKYVEYFLLRAKSIPYRTNNDPNRFVIDNVLPDKCRIALLGDWGTGQRRAKRVLSAVANRHPDIVIHLGDIYYSGTQFENDNYFFKIWSATLDLKKIRTFSLSGNHDMYSGGEPYYALIDKLGQPASYFNLRNTNWQFVAVDTGFNDHVPLSGDTTSLQPSENDWLHHQVAGAGGRSTVLLSHHQLFSAREKIGETYFNMKLNEQVKDILPEVAMWFWAHEHDQVIYEKFMGVSARCIGHGAFPVLTREMSKNPAFPNVPFKNVPLGDDGSAFNNGYVILDLDGKKMDISYFQVPQPGQKDLLFTESVS